MEARSEQERYESGVLPRELDPEIIKAIIRCQVMQEVQETPPEQWVLLLNKKAPRKGLL